MGGGCPQRLQTPSDRVTSRVIVSSPPNRDISFGRFREGRSRPLGGTDWPIGAISLLPIRFVVALFDRRVY